ncbi:MULTISPECIES: TAXI family TRAP transporter solute-binding subunit [Oceanimonas]|uniref:TAXI family TRAP transporter solute-binding subunit n=1 Tax=Oceanimonas smirnovii TaxID=264574 RepID=A0ABW7P158_9GAMM|nr:MULTISPECIES: TAXI family TRAP transporter solute-binding subunit [Oceanimonas]MDV2856374.1 TAXI family TRAP transporter solute-binding subunit [Oceanimonas sp. CAM02]
MKMFKHCLLGASLALSATTAQAAEFINVLTGGTSGVYYPLGVAISQLYDEHIPDSKVQVQATRASVENLSLLQKGRGEIGFALADSVADAWNGEKEAGFPAPLKKLRAVGATYSNYIQIVARADSGITSLEDLKGKRISVGAPRSGTELNARTIFKAAGLSYDDFSRTEYLPFGESVELMKNRQLDATLQSAGLGMAAFRDLASHAPVVFVAIPEALVAGIENDAYRPGLIPAGTYTGQDSDIPTVAISNLLITHEDVSDDTAYQMARQVFENLPALRNAHNAANGIEPEGAVKGLPLPLHPGAERYYREQGLIE